MKLDQPVNSSYAARVVKIRSITPLAGRDKIVGAPILGMQAIVGIDTQIGTVGVVLPTECQLSEEYCKYNNLYRHESQNRDPDKKGYIEDNRRVKAIKFAGHRSDCLFMPLESLAFTGVDISQLNEGDEFDTLNGIPICKKYVVVRRTGSGKTVVHAKAFQRVEPKLFPEHIDTDNYFRNEDRLDKSVEVIVTQKIHGTSIRIGYVPVRRKLTWYERLARKIGIRVQETEYDMVYGSRKVIKDANNPNQDHYYDCDIWTREGRKLDGLLPKNYIVYGELIGYTPEGSPLQKNYTYNLDPGFCDLYVYRVAVINSDGFSTDLAWDQVVELCKSNGLQTVAELWRGRLSDFKPEDWLDATFYPKYPNAVPLSKESPCDEGVVIRIDGLRPQVFKAKSPKFLVHESKMLDEEAYDPEEAVA